MASGAQRVGGDAEGADASPENQKLMWVKISVMDGANKSASKTLKKFLTVQKAGLVLTDIRVMFVVLKLKTIILRLIRTGR